MAAALLAVPACGAGDATAPLAKAPDMPADFRSKCSAAKGQDEPLIVEWPMADRAKLEALAHRTVVPVHYEGCEMHVLGQCSLHAAYKYTPITRKKGHVAIRNEDDLFAKLPIGAVNLEGMLQRSGALDVDMTLVGRWESDHLSVRRDELEGDCGQATHVITAVEVGSFVFTSGAGAAASASASVPVAGAGAGGHSANSIETLASDGDPTACSASTLSDANPPYGCGALIRVEVVPIAMTMPALPPHGDASGPSKPVPFVPPPAATSNACPAGQHYDSFRGCVSDAWVH